MGTVGPLKTGHTLFAVAAVLLGIIAVAFRAAALDHLPGINGDEAYYGAVVVAWKAGKRPPLVTGSGLPLNPFYTGLLYLLHLPNPAPSFWLLRLPALLSGLLLLALAYPLLARVFDRGTALGTTLLLACLPAAIAYSRFGWDQSQAPLAALVCLYFALRRRVIAAIIAFTAALMIHPLNVFLAPILLGPVAVEGIAQFGRLPAADRWRLLRRFGSVLLAGGLLCAAVFLLIPRTTVDWWLAQGALRDMGRRLIDPVGALHVSGLYSDFLSGITLYRFLAGPVPEWVLWLHRAVFFGLLLFLLCRGLPRLVRRRQLAALGIVGGVAGSLVAAYVLIGPGMIEPGVERYAMFLVTPGCLALVLLGRSLGESPAARRWQAAALLTVCGLLLAGFAQWYFGVLGATGGRAHRTFRTGPVEPKQAALQAVRAAAGDEPVTILAEDWWTYCPLYYLAGAGPEFHVRPVVRRTGGGEPRRRFLVGFAGGPCDLWLQRQAPELPREAVTDFAGRPVLYIWDLGYRTDLLPGLAAAAARVQVERQRDFD